MIKTVTLVLIFFILTSPAYSQVTLPPGEVTIDTSILEPVWSNEDEDFPTTIHFDLGGYISRDLVVRGTSILFMDGGRVGDDLWMEDFSTGYIHSGDIISGGTIAQDNATLHIYGGFFDTLYVKDNGIINVYGHNLSILNDYLQGTLSDGTQLVANEILLRHEGGTINLIPIPEPSTALFTFFALMTIMQRKRKTI